MSPGKRLGGVVLEIWDRLGILLRRTCGSINTMGRQHKGKYKGGDINFYFLI